MVDFRISLWANTALSAQTNPPSFWTLWGHKLCVRTEGGILQHHLISVGTCQPSLPFPPHPRLQQCRSPRPALLPQGKQWLEMATTGLCLPCCTATIPPCSASAWKIPPGCPAGDPQVMRFYSLSDFITPTSGRSQKRPDLCACTELPQFWQKSKHHQK